MSALATVGIGVRAQLGLDDFEPVGYSPAHDRRIEAYTQVVRETDSLLNTTFDEATPSRARSVANRWLHGAASGKLRTLEPVSFEDDMDVPVKAEILMANLSLSAYLNQLASREELAGSVPLAVEDLLLAYRLANVVKYSDFEAIGQLGLTQRKSLRTLADLMWRLNATERYSVGRQVASASRSRVPLSHLAYLGRTQFLDYLRRQQIPVPKSVTEADVDYYNSVGIKNSRKQVVEALMLGPLAEVQTGPGFFSSMRFGYQAEAAASALESTIQDEVEHPVRPESPPLYVATKPWPKNMRQLTLQSRSPVWRGTASVALGRDD